jgi:acyl carrier protein
MVPGAFVVLPEQPLTPSGKVDRRALPAPGREAAGQEYRAPATPSEEALAAIWAEVLGVDRVGAGDDFFALGGHSLLATRVAARVLRRMDVDLPLVAFFQHPTVERLAAHLDEGRWAREVLAGADAGGEGWEEGSL